MPSPSACAYWILLLGALAAANAQDGAIASRPNFDGQPIVEVRYDPPSQPVPADELAKLVPFHAGEPLHMDDARGAIEALFSTGRYSDVRVDAEPAAAGVIVVIRTAEQWFVGPVEVRGNFRRPPSTGEISNATRLDLGTPFQDGAIQQGAARIRSLLERNGFYHSTVEPEIRRDPQHQQVAITFHVAAKKRARLTSPLITGETKMPADEVAKAAKYKRWFRFKPATDSNVRSGVNNIRKRYGSADRLATTPTLTGREYLEEQNRVRPTIHVDASPKIKIETSGAKVSRKTLQNYVPVFDVQTVNRDLLVIGVRNLRDYFQNQGYFEAQVDFKITNVSPDEQRITYTITLGERHKLVDVQIAGNQYFTTEAIRDRMYLQPAGFLWLRHGRYGEGLLKRDVEAIRALYRSNGFLDVGVTTKTTDDYQGKAGDVAVSVTIDEGPQYLVSQVSLEGVDEAPRQLLLPRFASGPGQPFSETNVALDRDVVLTTYQSQGYTDVQFAWAMAMDHNTHRVSTRYMVTPGTQRFVRDVLLSGMHITKYRLVQPTIQLHAGDPLSWSKMGDMQRQLYDLGVFDKVDMAIQNPQGDFTEKYVLFHAVEGHRYYVAIGGGAEVARIGGNQDDLSQPAGATGFSARGSFEASRLNMFGLGHSLNFKSKYSTLDRLVSLNYLAPRYHNVDGRNISFTALYDDTRDVRTFTSQRLEGSMQLSQRFSKATTAFWRYTWRDVRVDENTLKIDPLLIPTVAQPAKVAFLNANVVQDRRDDPTNAHRGVYRTGDLSVAEHFLGGNKNFLRFLGRNGYYKSIGRYTVLATNTQFGVIKPFYYPSTTNAFDYMPLPERFFGGGSASHRGFPDNQAGPRDLKTGFPLGGNALLFHSTEIRFPLIGNNIRGVLFHDMGNIFRTLSSLSFRVHQKDEKDFDYMVHAVGFGIRYRTPVGPVRVDLSYSMNAPRFFGLKGTYQDLINGTATPELQRVSRFQFFFSIGEAF